MLPAEQEALLGDILIYARKILGFTHGVTQEAFAANEEKQFAVIRCLDPSSFGSYEACEIAWFTTTGT